MSELRRKHFKGWISTAAMTEPLWLNVWLEAAATAEKSDSELVIFQIPKNRLGLTDWELVEFIEKYIQDRASAAKAALSIFESSAPKFEQFQRLFEQQLENDTSISKKTAYYRAEALYFQQYGEYKYKKRGGYECFRVVKCRLEKRKLTRMSVNS